MALFDLFRKKPKPEDLVARPSVAADEATGADGGEAVSGDLPAYTGAATRPIEEQAATEGRPTGDSAPLRQRSRLAIALNRTRAMLTAAFEADPESLVDEDYFVELTDALITADVGVDLAQRLAGQIEREMHDRGLVRRRDTARVAREVLLAKLRDVREPQALQPGRLNVVMLVGVNGNGKTTCAAKLAHRLKGAGFKVLLAAADTFRAAAVDQLKVWAERAGVDIVAGQTGADPASVIFDATQAARARGTDVLIVDTAGRLQTKHNLMAELQKISKTVEKAVQPSSGDTPVAGSAAAITNLLVLDATVGQNSLSQAQLFNEACELSGVVLTKLDGTARGGGALAIVDLLRVPVVFAGVGEGLEDLIEFDAVEYVSSLVPQ